MTDPLPQVAFPLIRKVYPKLVAAELLSVQPMRLTRGQRLRQRWNRFVDEHRWMKALGFTSGWYVVFVDPNSSRAARLTPAQYADHLDRLLKAMFHAKVEHNPVIDTYGMQRLYNAVRWAQINAEKVARVHDFLRGWRWQWYNQDGNDWLTAPDALTAALAGMDNDVQRGRFTISTWNT